MVWTYFVYGGDLFEPRWPSQPFRGLPNIIYNSIENNLGMFWGYIFAHVHASMCTSAHNHVEGEKEGRRDKLVI